MRLVDQVACRHVVRDDEGEILADCGIRDHVLVRDRIARDLEQPLEVELEGGPASLEQRGMDLTHPARVQNRRLPGMKQLMPAWPEASIGLEHGVERFSHTLCP